jgi:hypothetical protein
MRRRMILGRCSFSDGGLMEKAAGRGIDQAGWTRFLSGFRYWQRRPAQPPVHERDARENA